MAPTTTQEGGEGGEASRPRSGARRRAPPRGGLRLSPTATNEEGEASRPRSGRRRSPAPRGGPRLAPTATNEEEEASPRSHRGKRKRRDAQERPKKRKKSRVSGKRRASKVESSSASAATEEACSSEASSAVSSPLRWPCRPCITNGPGVSLMADLDPETEAAYEEAQLKFYDKEARHRKLVTLDEPAVDSYIAREEFLPIRDSATQVFLKAGKAVLGLSSYVDGNPLSRSSGFIVDWDKSSKSCTILTSALLICSKPPQDEWSSDTVDYATNAEVVVHLLDKNETTVAAHLLHYDKHFNVALFKIDTYISVETPLFCTEVMYGDEGFVLGRNDDRFLKIDYGRFLYRGPSIYERHHHMFISCGLGSQCGVGGPVMNLKGQVLGMIYQGLRFTPSSILLKCLHMWKTIGCIPRLHMGMKFSPIKFLDPAHIEMISIKCNIDTGLIVNEVSEGSAAEKIGLRNGDIIECLNGVSVATTVELENMLLSICQNQHDEGKVIGSTVDVTVGVFHTRKELQCTKKLTLKLSDDMEIFARGTYNVPASGEFSSGRNVMMLA